MEKTQKINRLSLAKILLGVVLYLMVFLAAHPTRNKKNHPLQISHLKGQARQK
jgi:hypothetical protein